MEAKAIRILDEHRTMAIATVRPDGWPQVTIVGYVNDGLLLYFIIARTSQKFANIAREPRVAVAIGEEPRDLSELKAVYAGAHASEVTDPQERRNAWGLLVNRHPNLNAYEMPEPTESALMRAACKHVSILDYTKGLGHTDNLTFSGSVGEDGASGADYWGLLGICRKDTTTARAP